ncbi:Hsp20/alpha crystallin family protein [Novosphingobium kaempferiae]|uniref:Hsp20/alpha crystallin family protein n=1 Tax=Novosphingobium kaempferiae TaxID=2896849 RepID=UPI001E643430|nr:Hsp20/alpha crystallin family protein [Novosphingobium kaempferiae]
MPALAGFDRAVGWPHAEFGETDKEIYVTAELPGLDEKGEEVTVEDGALTLRGEERSEVEDKDRGYTERGYGRFERRIGLRQGIDRDHAAATFRNGVLTVTLPKTEEANENVRRILVNGKAA